jgi:predicted phosphoadenosine phosphosulfate sulfurtransferase
VAAYVNRLFEEEPHRAFFWIQQCPPELQENATRNFVQRWYNTDSESLSTWVNSLPKGAQRDIALECITQRLRMSDQSKAKEVAAQIDDRAKRDRLLRGLR